MPAARQSVLSFNRGLISRLGLARLDLNRTAMSAEIMTNWMPRTLGSMMLRPGIGYIDNTNDDARAKLLPFVFATDDTAQLEISTGGLRVRIDDALVTRNAVSDSITNGAFNTNLTGWTDNDEAGGASAWATGGYLALLGNGTAAAIRTQQVTLTSSGTERALRVVVARGPVTFMVGSSAGADDYVAETTLGTGAHSLAFAPTTNYHIRLQSRRSYTTFVDSVSIEEAGAMELPAPWAESALPLLRTSQSGDVIYVACAGYQQRKIERRGARSWSIVLYEPETGPFRNVNTSPITLTPNGLFGDITLTASANLFKSTNVGSLFRIQSTGQTVSDSITAEDTFSNEIRVAGVGGTRIFSIFVSNTFTATVTLQQSVGDPGNWTDVESYTTIQSKTYNDELDNQIIYYRIGVKAGEYTSGSVDVSLHYAGAAQTGIVRIKDYTSGTSVTADVLVGLGGITATDDWAEGEWSDYRGWPAAVALHDGRLFWMGGLKVWGWPDQQDDRDGRARRWTVADLRSTVDCRYGIAGIVDPVEFV
jgi:hypothetical protein